METTEITRLTATAETLATQMIASITGGEIEPMRALALVDAMERACKEVKDNADVQRAWQETIAREGKQGVTVNGRNYTLAEGGVKYDFTQCNCFRWEELTRQINALTEERKKVEDMLKHLSGSVVDADTGEVLHLPERTSRTIIKSIKTR